LGAEIKEVFINIAINKFPHTLATNNAHIKQENINHNPLSYAG